MIPNLLNPAAPPPPPVVPKPVGGIPVLGAPHLGNPAMQAMASPPPALPTASAPILAPQLPGSPPVLAVPAAPDPDDKHTEAELIEQYIALRDEKKRREAAHKEAIDKQFVQRMDRIETVMKGRLDRGNLTQFKADTGTAFTKTVSRYSVDDAAVFMPWVEANGQTDMLKRDVKQDPVRDYFEHTGTLPPGIKVWSEVVVQFRR